MYHAIGHLVSGTDFAYRATPCAVHSPRTMSGPDPYVKLHQVDAKGQTVVDLFAGIGYFTVPLLATGGAKVLDPNCLIPPFFLLWAVSVRCPTSVFKVLRSP